MNDHIIYTMKFEDLIFEPHYVLNEIRCAKVILDNGLQISIFGGPFSFIHGNGIDSFEVGIFDSNDKKIMDSPHRYCSKSRVLELIEQAKKYQTL